MDVEEKLSHMYNITEEHLLNITTQLNCEEIYKLYKFFDICIPMRYHGCLFAIYNNIPIFPLFTTRKIENLLLDYNITQDIKLKSNENGITE